MTNKKQWSNWNGIEGCKHKAPMACSNDQKKYKETNKPKTNLTENRGETYVMGITNVIFLIW